MALRDAFSRFLRGRAEAQRGNGDGGGDDRSATALASLADDIESGDDADLVALVERVEGFYDPETGDAATASDGRSGE